MTHRSRFHSNDHVDHLLPAYINGTLDQETQERVHTHLGLCEACRNDLVEWEAIASATRTFASSLHVPAGQGGRDIQFQNHWEELKPTVYPPNLLRPAEPGALASSAPVSNRVRKLAAPPSTGRLNIWLSAAIVVLLLLGTLAGAWWLGGAGGGSTREEPSRYAAMGLATGTPASGASFWTTPVMPEGCVADRMDRETYADIMRTAPTPEPRSYLPVTPVERSVAKDVAFAGRAREACLIFGEMEQWRTLETPSFLYARTAGEPTPSPGETETLNELSNHLPIVPFDEQVIYTQERMPAQLADRPEGTHEAQMMTSTYLPDYAFQLADGRVAVAVGVILWANPQDEHFKVRIEENPDAQGTTYGVFTLVDGTWLYDQTFTICAGGCSRREATPVASPIANGSVPGPPSRSVPAPER